MLQFGKKQDLVMVKKMDFGMYLAPRTEEEPYEEDGREALPEAGETTYPQKEATASGGRVRPTRREAGKESPLKEAEPRISRAYEQEKVLLPRKQVPEGAKLGDVLRVFLYKDSMDRPIATTREPKILLHELALLQVVQVTRIGAFLDWGLEKDLLLPFREQTHEVREGDTCLVALYLDKSERLCATMKVYHFLATNSPYIVGDTVTGLIYEISEQFGAFVAVDYKYSALIPAKEAQAGYRVGDIVDLRVTEVKEDGKLTVSARKKAYLQMSDDAEMILELLAEYEGILPFDDKASPEEIKEVCHLSKNAFKRAVGRLLKEKRIVIEDGYIRTKKYR